MIRSVSNRIKIHTQTQHYDPGFRGELIDILKPFIGKPESYSNDQRIKEYGISSNEYEITDNLEDSDLAILPMSWNFYRNTKKMKLAEQFVISSAQFGKLVVSWVTGDFGVDVPFHDNLIVFRANGYRSKLPENHYGIAPFFQDPLQSIYSRTEIIPKKWKPSPTIGFCGQAKGSLFQYGWGITRTIIRNLKYAAGISPFQPHSILPNPLWLRAQTLSLVESDSRLEANFIKRTKYRAGAITKELIERTTREFYNNMVESDYIICVRGGGNFSVRLFETLAMGRIPVFVDTDCLLPFSNIIKWDNHLLWIPYNQLNKIGSLIHEFHNKLSSDEFLDLQSKNRKIWEEKLRLHSFFKTQLNELTRK